MIVSRSPAPFAASSASAATSARRYHSSASSSRPSSSSTVGAGGEQRRGSIRMPGRGRAPGCRARAGHDPADRGRARARHGDRELDAHRRRQSRPVDRAADLERAIGTADAALAVDHERDLVVAPGDPAVRAQLAQRESEIAGRIGGDREGLAHDRDAARATGCRHRVLVCELGVHLDELRRHREVTRHPLGVLLAQCLEFVARTRGQILRRDLVGNERIVVVRANRTVLLGTIQLDGTIDATAGRAPPRCWSGRRVARRVRLPLAIAGRVRLPLAIAGRVRLPLAIARRVRLLLPSRGGYDFRSPSRGGYGFAPVALRVRLPRHRAAGTTSAPRHAAGTTSARHRAADTTSAHHRAAAYGFRSPSRGGYDFRSPSRGGYDFRSPSRGGYGLLPSRAGTTSAHHRAAGTTSAHHHAAGTTSRRPASRTASLTITGRIRLPLAVTRRVRLPALRRGAGTTSRRHLAACMDSCHRHASHTASLPSRWYGLLRARLLAGAGSARGTLIAARTRLAIAPVVARLLICHLSILPGARPGQSRLLTRNGHPALGGHFSKEVRRCPTLHRVPPAVPSA